MRRTNIVLIGMPGSGKSTVGVLLAKRTCRDFVDTDVAIQVATGMSLQQLVDQQGHVAFRELEERVILDLSVARHVVATGGSAVYSDSAMKQLQEHGVVVYLQAGIETLRQRLGDFSRRGLAGPPGQTLEAMLAERAPLYDRYAQIEVACDSLNADQVAREVADELAQRSGELSFDGD